MELKPREVEEDVEDYIYSWDWIQNTPWEVGRSTIELFCFY